MTMEKQKKLPDIVEFAYTNYEVKEIGKTEALCKFCTRKVGISDTGGSTSNKNKHFKKYHQSK